MSALNASNAGLYGRDANEHGGAYRNGARATLETRLRLEKVYLEATAENNGYRPKIAKVARDSQCSRALVRNVEEEIRLHGHVIDPDVKKLEALRALGPGVRTIFVLEQHTLLALRMEQPCRSLASYRQRLYFVTGSDVSESTISRFFKEGFPFKGTLRVANLVPYDKYRPENIRRAHEYIHIIARFNPWRIKFCDEKHFCGSDFFNRKVRADPLTGEVPLIITDSDFRNTYNIIGFIGIDRRTSPFNWFHCTDKNDAMYFSMCLEKMIATRQLLPYDVLVVDNWSGHKGGENKDLDEMLWDWPDPATREPMRIMLIFLPTRTPEFNPIEKVWNGSVMKIKTYPIAGYRDTDHAVLRIAIDVFKRFTHEDMEKYYASCGLIHEPEI